MAPKQPVWWLDQVAPKQPVWWLDQVAPKQPVWWLDQVAPKQPVWWLDPVFYNVPVHGRVKRGTNIIMKYTGIYRMGQRNFRMPFPEQ